MQVLSSGTLANGIGVMPAGGHIEPTSIAGESAKCRYAQKKQKKRKTSEAIKSKNPIRSERHTVAV
jgi:hypothetical protein